VYQIRVVIVKGEGAVLGVNLGSPFVTSGDFATKLFPNYFGQDLLAICRPNGCTVAFGDVIVVVGVCNRSHMRTSKCTCLIFGVSIGLVPGYIEMHRRNF